MIPRLLSVVPVARHLIEEETEFAYRDFLVFPTGRLSKRRSPY